MNEHDSLVSQNKDTKMTQNPNAPLTAHNLKNFAAIAALNGIIAAEGAPAKESLSYKDVMENDIARAIDYANALVKLLE
jgi:hypothetical protein